MCEPPWRSLVTGVSPGTHCRAPARGVLGRIHAWVGASSRANCRGATRRRPGVEWRTGRTHMCAPPPETHPHVRQAKVRTQDTVGRLIKPRTKPSLTRSTFAPAVWRCQEAHLLIIGEAPPPGQAPEPGRRLATKGAAVVGRGASLLPGRLG